MGKIRRARTKRHIEAVKSNATDEDSVDLEDFIPNQVYKTNAFCEL